MCQRQESSNSSVISRVENKLFTCCFLQEIWLHKFISYEAAQVVEIHPQEMQEPDFLQG